MENKQRFLIYLFFIGIAIVAIPFFVFAYDAVVTHPDLTREIAKFYNLTLGKDNKLSSQEIEWLAKGAVDEDITPRWLNHYYNPETEQGLKGENLGWIPDVITEKGISIFVSTKEPVSSKNWARNQALQQSYVLYGGNHTWQKALSEYAKENKKDAFISLGNLLHLIEDASVPDHTRSDSHADIAGTGDKGSPYEIWGEKNNAKGINIAKEFFNKNLKPYKYNSYEEYLENLAKYSHYNFFSKDTIFDKIQTSPYITIVKNQGEFFYGYNKYDIPILAYNKNKVILGIDDDIIMSAYWENLSREAVLHGAGVIELFLREGEALKQNKELIKQMEKQERVSIVDNVLNKNIAFSPANAIQKISEKIELGVVFVKDKTLFIYKKAYSNLNKIASGFLFSNDDLFRSMDISQNNNVNEIDDNNDEEYENNLQSELLRISLENTSYKIYNEDEVYEKILEIEKLLEKYKVEARNLENEYRFIVESKNNKDNSQNNKQDEYNDKEIDFDEKYDNNNYMDKDIGGAKEYISYNQGDVIFSEIDWKGAVGNSSYEWIELYGNGASAINLEGWTIEKKNSEGVFSFLIGDSGDNFNNTHIISSGSYFLLERNEFATSIASDKRYDGELGNSGEHLFLKDANGNIIDEINYLNGWQDNSNDYSRTMSKINNIWAVGIETPKAVNTAYIVPEEQEIIEEITEPDAITYNARDIVINEIAWMGDSSDANNEWIELYNATTTDINLFDWKLEAQDGSPDIFLSGTISSGAYFLLERTNDNSAPNVVADLIYTGALNNTGEVLILKDSNNQEIDRVDMWHAGDNTNKKTMQRISSTLSGTLSTNWITNTGTPKAINDLSVLPLPTLSYNSGDVIINELSWAGTIASSSDEWIELRNTATENIDLTGWTIELIPDNASTTIIALSNAFETVIQTGNATSTEPYFLMERSNDNSVSNVVADLIYTGALNNSDFTIKLKDPSGNVIDSVSAISNWEKGNNTIKQTMERKADLTWITFGETNEYGADGYYLNVDNNTFIKDAGNNKILGSPRQPNSDIEDYPPFGNLSFSLTFN